MKLIYKNQKIKIFSLLLMLVGIVSLGFFMQGCSEDALDNKVDNMDNGMISAKYLDLDVTSTTVFTPEEIKIIAYASYRIVMHMVYNSDSNKYVFDLKSPAEINVSERLYNYIYPGVDMHPTDMPRLKGDEMECFTSSGWGWTQTKCYMNDADMVKVLNALQSTYGQASNIMNWIAIATAKYPLLATAIAIYSQAISNQGSTIDQTYHDYLLNSGRRGGTGTETRVSVPNAGYITTYQFSY